MQGIQSIDILIKSQEINFHGDRRNIDIEFGFWFAGGEKQSHP